MKMTLVKMLLLSVFLMFATYGADSTDLIEETYKSALQYRDGKDGFNQDPEKAKELFLTVVSTDPNHMKALHNLGMLAYKKKLYDEASAYFERSKQLGLIESSKNIWRMMIAKEIPASPKERFLAICDLHDYPLPVDRNQFNFNCTMVQCENSGTMSLGGALYTQELNNSGVLSFPVIWVENKDKFINTGEIRAKLLIVGQKRIS